MTLVNSKLENISTKFRNEHVDSISFSVLKSAIQKYIRRSNLDKALWTASRLDYFYGYEGGEKLRTNFIHRLMIIFLEDVGIEGLPYWKEIDYLLFDICLSNRKSKNRDRELEIGAIKRAITIMCSIKKSRLCSYLNSIMVSTDQTLKNTSYNKIVECNTIKDNTIVDKLNFAKYVYNSEDKFSILSNYFNTNIINISKKWYKEIKTKEQFTTWSILLANIVYNPNYSNLNLLPFNKINIDKSLRENGDWSKELSITTCVYDDFVYDKHTKNAKDKSTKYFAEVSSYVYPESELVDIHSKNIYLVVRGGKPIASESEMVEKPILESEFATFVSRTQLTTSCNKTDVYIATKDKITYIIKGPFLNSVNINRYMKFIDEKMELGIPTIDTQIINMIPDRWIEGVPLGMRNKVDRKKEYPFLVIKSLIPASKFVFRTHSSRLWPATQIIDSSATILHFSDLAELTDRQKIDWLNAIAFRLKYKLSDLGNRNFLVYAGRLFSIDEESINPNFNLLNELKTTKYNQTKEFYKKFGDRVISTLKSYLDTEFSD